MTGLPYLLARLERGGGSVLDPGTCRELAGLRTRFSACSCTSPTWAEAFLFRLAVASPPTARSLPADRPHPHHRLVTRVNEVTSVDAGRGRVVVDRSEPGRPLHDQEDDDRQQMRCRPRPPPSRDSPTPSTPTSGPARRRPPSGPRRKQRRRPRAGRLRRGGQGQRGGVGQRSGRGEHGPECRSGWWPGRRSRSRRRTTSGDAGHVATDGARKRSAVAAGCNGSTAGRMLSWLAATRPAEPASNTRPNCCSSPGCTRSWNTNDDPET